MFCILVKVSKGELVKERKVHVKAKKVKGLYLGNLMEVEKVKRETRQQSFGK